MKRFFAFVALAGAMLLASCSEFDDSKIWDKLDNHESRISQLEELCKQMNTNISSLQTIVAALQQNDYITNVSPVRKDGDIIGYTITFAHSDTITIYHGTNGEDGEDGYTPQIGVMKDVDDIYYWTIDGEWLLDGKGNKIQAIGKNGEDGENGKDSITPRLKIENDYWHVSYDEGVTWEQLGKATGNSNSCIIEQIVETEEDVIFTLADGTKITLSKKVMVKHADNVILYTTPNEKKITLYECHINTFGAILLSNKYIDGQGVMIFDDAVTTIEGEAFRNCVFTSLVIPRMVTNMDLGAFMNAKVEKLYCMAETPPYLSDSSTPSFASIYVPYQAVEAYKNKPHTAWSKNLKDRIFGYDFENGIEW